MGVKSSSNNFWNEGWPSEKQNLIQSWESTPTKEEAPQLMQPWSQFNSKQPIKVPDAPPPCSFPSPCWCEKKWQKLDDSWMWMGGKRSNNNFWNEWWPSEKLNLVSSRESTHTKDEVPQLTQPWFQCNSKEPIKLLDAPPQLLLSFLVLMWKHADVMAVLCFLLGCVGRGEMQDCKICVNKTEYYDTMVHNTYKYVYRVTIFICFHIDSNLDSTQK